MKVAKAKLAAVCPLGKLSKPCPGRFSPIATFKTSTATWLVSKVRRRGAKRARHRQTTPSPPKSRAHQ